LEQKIILKNAGDEQRRKQQDAARKFLKLKDTMKSEMVGLKETSPFNHSYMNSHLDNPDICPSPGQFMKDSRSDHLNVHPPSNHPNMRPRFDHPDIRPPFDHPISRPHFEDHYNPSTF